MSRIENTLADIASAAFDTALLTPTSARSTGSTTIAPAADVANGDTAGASISPPPAERGIRTQL